MEFTLSLRRLPKVEGWSINTFHDSSRGDMRVRLSHKDGREDTLTFTDREIMSDLSRCQQHLLTWVSHVTGGGVADDETLHRSTTRQITLDE